MVHGVRTRVVAWTIVLRQSVTEDYLFELREQFNGDGSDDDGADGKRRYLGLRVSCGRFEPSTLIPARMPCARTPAALFACLIVACPRCLRSSPSLA